MVYEFSQASNPGIYPGAGTQLTGISNLSLQLSNTANGSPGTTFNGEAGNFNVYFIPDSDTTTATTSLRFETADVTGLNGQGSTSNSTLLGTFSFNQTVLGYDTFTAGALGSTVATDLENALNTGANFRIAVTPQTTGMVADWDATHDEASAKAFDDGPERADDRR